MDVLVRRKLRNPADEDVHLTFTTTQGFKLDKTPGAYFKKGSCPLSLSRSLTPRGLALGHGPSSV